MKNTILTSLIGLLDRKRSDIIKQNNIDVSLARNSGIAENIIDRLLLNDARIDAMVECVKRIILLEDPTGRALSEWKNTDNGLVFKKVSVPIGKILMIYEARPNVTIESAALAIKSGNSIILKGGSDSLHSSAFLVSLIHEAFINSGYGDCKDTIEFVNSKDRSITKQLLQRSDIDLVIPRGGRGLVEFVSQNTNIPILKHLDGNCHTYINNAANKEKALDVLLNAKMRRTSTCNATESLVIDEEIAEVLLLQIYDSFTKLGCKLVGCEKSTNIDGRISSATDDDFFTEYLSAKISVKVVKNCQEAVSWINKHSSQHTEAILTEDSFAADYFCKNITSAVIMHNASTQFCDGYQFGFGAEIGIATGRLHARGPVALEALCTYKYIVVGDYSVRS